MKTVKRVVDNITMVAIAENEAMAIGFSVQDEDDEPNSKRGVDIATGRAQKALALKKGEFFRRPDVIVDFHKAGFNTRGIKGAPKSIFQQKESKPDLRKFEVLMNRKPIMKALGLPL